MTEPPEPGDKVECVLCHETFIYPEDAPFKEAICPRCMLKQQGCSG